MPDAEPSASPPTELRGGTSLETVGGEVAESIERFLIDNFLLDEAHLDYDTSLIESGIIDSTGAMEVVAFLEDTFAIPIDDEDLVAENLDSITRLARFVAAKQSPPAEGSCEGAT